MLLNLADPEWLTINCSRKYPMDIICMKKNGNTNSISFEPLQKFCTNSNVMKGSSFYQFNYFHGKYMTLAGTISETKSTFHSVKEIHCILVAVKVTFPAI